MTVRPITFTGPMVCALLDGRKTQTRRVLKPDTVSDGFPGPMWPNYLNGKRLGRISGTPDICNLAEDGEPPLWSGPTQYAPGDLLYVRECWRASREYNDTAPRHLPSTTPIQYEVNEPRRNGRSLAGRFRAAMHMPRWASRLTLKVTDVRVQRVQEISEADAMAEGAPPVLVPPDGGGHPHRVGFENLWDSINASREGGAYAWASNPFVVALRFNVIHQNVDEYLEGAAA